MPDLLILSALESLYRQVNLDQSSSEEGDVTNTAESYTNFGRKDGGSSLEINKPIIEAFPALKEWAVVCASILEGEQILTIRKGGIKEEGRRFAVRHPQFLLFPTYEHQAPEHIKPAYRRRITRLPDSSASGTSPSPTSAPEVTHSIAISNEPNDSGDTVRLESYCEVVDVFEITEARALDALDSMHIWQKSYVQERLRWKPRQPLLVIALRAYALQKPICVPYLESYGGCKSWIDIELPGDISLEAEPALSDTAFGAKLEALRKTLQVQP